MTSGTPPGPRVVFSAKARVAVGACRWGLPTALLTGLFLVPVPPPHARLLLGIPVLCPFRRATGLPCPGCGLTRALVCVAHGRIGESLAYHPLAGAVFVVLVVWTAACLMGKPLRLSVRLQTTLAWTGIAGFLIVWTARLAYLLPSPP